ncbi:MAG: hypothetical protein IPM47_03525 [Sphingobacteriales bacterium]|nr:MAG: hypothetical protein IPM47_03525 [Sphingobacteriales bacterium]
MKKLMNFAAVAIAVIGSFFATNHANAQTILASPALTPEQVVNYVVQNYTVVHFTIASNETADNKIMPVSTGQPAAWQKPTPLANRSKAQQRTATTRKPTTPMICSTNKIR